MNEYLSKMKISYEKINKKDKNYNVLSDYLDSCLSVLMLDSL